MSWIGEYQLGDSLPLRIRVTDANGAPTLPDNPPRAIVSSSGGQVESLLLPIRDRSDETAFFQTTVILDGKYETGKHSIQYLFTISGTQKSTLDEFNILPGGDPTGTGIAMEFFGVSPNRFLLVQNDGGQLVKKKNPRIT